eukprot:CAMPEP_0196655698 /NCGR_PEP_ID=MMETSP1086-20130531/6021_1 /TAXON_ID=77921 /ORGANISM="Cyanoptyche  gloeocystis , Strain SAG4.97" /LENGTH=141 /DNA_ID=CAMNT_0041988153 /DNA_START=325 /DNA_END=750 /DNA_ORIENTATION=+
MGLANAESDKLTDFSSCDFHGRNFQNQAFSGALLNKTNFEGSDMKNTQLTKSNAAGAIFRGVDFTGSVLDRVNFKGADMRDAIFANAVLAGSNFDAADITGADFSDSMIDTQQFRALCKIAEGVNPVTGVSTRESIGCPDK